MKINELQFVPDEPVTKTLKLGDAEYTVGIKQIAFGDMERIGNSAAALISHAVVLDGGETLSEPQVARLPVATASALLALINEVNAAKN